MLEIRESRPAHRQEVKVDFGFFDRYRKSGRNEKGKMVYPRIALRNKHSSFDEEDSSELEIDDRFQSRVPKPILRRRSFNENEKSRPVMKDGKNGGAGGGEEMPPEQPTKKEKKAKVEQPEIPESLPIRETTINGIPLSKLPRERERENREKVEKRPPKKPKPKVNKEPEPPVIPEEKTVEDLEKEGAQNFARCLLGILPSVLSATEPSVTDESLQQFSSDVCEAVTCLALKRKNVPNFGSIRQHEMKPEESDDDPSLNADGVYKTVYETLHLSFRLNKSGFYKKKLTNVPITQVMFSSFHIQKIKSRYSGSKLIFEAVLHKIWYQRR